ncbi:MAG: phage portal protein [Bacteroidales bacterium]|nr:phage portal protein [Bacteroidales bacterium]
MNVDELILDSEVPASEKVRKLKVKAYAVPEWSKLEKEYNPNLHPVMNEKLYQDKPRKSGEAPEKAIRIKLGLQKLATKRMAEMIFGIPVKRVYSAKTDEEKKVAAIIEKILAKNRIDSVNLKRAKKLYSSCEILTIWYAKEETNSAYGEETSLKLRCKTYSPKDKDSIYVSVDEFEDVVALSVGYIRVEDEKNVEYLDTYTAQYHTRYRNDGSEWVEDISPEKISIGKIPGIYTYREEPIWEDTSDNTYEIEWSLSRAGNYLRKNQKPIFGIFSDKKITVGKEKTDDNEGRSVLRFGKDDKAEYIGWEQATDSLKYFNDTLYRQFFTQIQLPDLSFDNMKATPMSGEARIQMFIDAHLKVEDEKGDIIEFLDREVNVIKAFLVIMYPNYKKAIESLSVEHIITPYAIANGKEKVEELSTGAGGKAIVSRRTAVQNLGLATDVEQEMKELEKDDAVIINGIYNA